MYSRQYVVGRLRCFGLPGLAEEALHDMPDRVDSDHLWDWGGRHGITKDELISWMGGSP